MKAQLTILFLILFLSACSSGSGGSPPVVLAETEKITLIGSDDLGIFDPSITRDPGTGKLWMSYSTVKTSVFYDPSVYWAVSIRLASSGDNGATWRDEGLIVDKVESTFGAIAVPEGNIAAGDKGIWQSETSALIYDPSANLGEEWKLIWFQYMHANSTSYFASYSWIAMKAASTPEGLVTATAVKLFGGAGLATNNNITGTPVFSPVAGVPAVQLNTGLTNSAAGADLSDLNLCVFAEPGLHTTNNAVYMAIFCADATTVPVTQYLVYFRCASPCNMTDAASWEYLGRLLTPADAQAATGDNHFQAPALVEKNAQTYVVVTPVDTTSGNRYNGCRVYELSDVDSNQLRRNSGQLVEVARVDGNTGTHNGACAAFSGLDGGILFSQFEVANITEKFKVYKSQVSLP